MVTSFHCIQKEDTKTLECKRYMDVDVSGRYKLFMHCLSASPSDSYKYSCRVCLYLAFVSDLSFWKCLKPYKISYLFDIMLTDFCHFIISVERTNLLRVSTFLIGWHCIVFGVFSYLIYGSHHIDYSLYCNTRIYALTITIIPSRTHAVVNLRSILLIKSHTLIRTR